MKMASLAFMRSSLYRKVAAVNGSFCPPVHGLLRSPQPANRPATLEFTPTCKYAKAILTLACLFSLPSWPQQAKRTEFMSRDLKECSGQAKDVTRMPAQAFYARCPARTAADRKSNRPLFLVEMFFPAS